MDTILLCKVYGNDEDASPYIYLKETPAPYGCKAWITSLKKINSHICWIKVQCHEIIGLQTANSLAIERLRTVVAGWISCAGLHLADFTLKRIDYDYNFYLPVETAEVLIETMQHLSPQILRMIKWNDPDSVYYANKSRHAQIYRKDRERKEKGRKVKEEEIGLCRQEIQCHPARIKYMRHQYGLLCDWDNWVSAEMEATYLTSAEPIFQLGDFYSLDRAVDLIQASDFTPCYKQRLQDALTTVEHGTMDDLKAKYSRNTLKKYMEKLKELNICPLPIPENKYDIDYIENPFFKREGI